MEDHERAWARSFAQRLIDVSQENGVGADEARNELASLNHRLSDFVADELVRALENDPLRVCAVFSNHVVPLWFESGRTKLAVRLDALSVTEPAFETYAMLLRTFQVRRDELERAGVARRVTSAFVRPWVLAFVWLPLGALAVLAALTEKATVRLLSIMSIGVLVGLVLTVEAVRRRCPSCKRWFSAMDVGVRHTGTTVESVNVETSRGTEHLVRQVNGYSSVLTCTRCGFRWER